MFKRLVKLFLRVRKTYQEQVYLQFNQLGFDSKGVVRVIKNVVINEKW